MNKVKFQARIGDKLDQVLSSLMSAIQNITNVLYQMVLKLIVVKSRKICLRWSSKPMVTL